MLEPKFIFTCMELWGSLFAILASIYLFIGKSVIKEQYKALAILELTAGIMLFFDGWAWFFDGVPGAFYNDVLHVANFISFLCNAILPVFVLEYVILSIDKSKRDRRVHIVICTLAVVAMIFLTVSQFTDYIYRIDPITNVYKRGVGFVAWTVLVLVEANIDFVYTFLKKDDMDKKRFITIICFIVLPILATAIQVFAYGISLSNTAIIIVALVMFAQALEDNARTMLEQREHIANQERIMQDMRTRIALSQIRPHFLTNALNSLYTLCDKDIFKAKELVNSLSDYLRTNIASIDTDQLIPFEKELEHTKAYLDIEKIRLSDKFDVVYDIKVKDFQMPALTIQPIVENAVNHGISKKAYGSPGQITIKTEDGNGYIKVSISDNGVGFDLEEYKAEADLEEKHIGIENVKKRLEIMENAEMKITSSIGVGTTVDIIIPN